VVFDFPEEENGEEVSVETNQQPVEMEIGDTPPRNNSELGMYLLIA